MTVLAKPKGPTTTTSPERRAEIGAGASEWASGSHEWNGIMPPLVPKAQTKQATMVSASEVGQQRRPACPCRARGSATASGSTVVIRAKMKTAPITAKSIAMTTSRLYLNEAISAYFVL